MIDYGSEYYEEILSNYIKLGLKRHGEWL